MKRIKTAIVGYGYSGEVLHTPLIQSVPNLELHTVAETRPERWRVIENKGLKVYESIDKLLENREVELVVLATPHDTHKDLAVKCLNAGRHVVTDKIMCLNPEEAEIMINTSKNNNRMLSVFHNRRWDGDYLVLKQAMEENIAGKPLQIKSYVASAGVPSKDRWRGSREKGGGIFSDWGAHILDQALQLNPTKVVSVYCVMDYFLPDIDVETYALCVLEFENGVKHFLETTIMNHSNSKGYVLLGLDGRLEIKGFDPQEAVLNEKVRGLVNMSSEIFRSALYRKGKEEVLLDPIEGNWSNFYKNISEHILFGKELSVKPESVKRMIEVRDAAFKSVENKRVIECLI